jgi:hypothetical protein
MAAVINPPVRMMLMWGVLKRLLRRARIGGSNWSLLIAIGYREAARMPPFAVVTKAATAATAKSVKGGERNGRESGAEFRAAEDSYGDYDDGNVQHTYDKPGENHSEGQVSAGVFYFFCDAGDFCQATIAYEHKTCGGQDGQPALFEKPAVSHRLNGSGSEEDIKSEYGEQHADEQDLKSARMFHTDNVKGGES